MVSKTQKISSGRAEVGGEEQKEAQELHGAAGDPAGLGGDYPEPGVCRGRLGHAGARETTATQKEGFLILLALVIIHQYIALKVKEGF